MRSALSFTSPFPFFASLLWTDDEQQPERRLPSLPLYEYVVAYGWSSVVERERERIHRPREQPQAEEQEGRRGRASHDGRGDEGAEALDSCERRVGRRTAERKEGEGKEKRREGKGGLLSVLGG